MKKYIICLLCLFALSCAPVYEIYLSPSDIGRVKDQKIVKIDTIRTGEGTIYHIKYKD